MSEQERERIKELGRRGSESQQKIQAEFMKRLKELSNGESSYAFAKRLGMNQSTVYNYIMGIRFPGADALVKIAEKCGVTVDWLLGVDSHGG